MIEQAFNDFLERTGQTDVSPQTKEGLRAIFCSGWTAALLLVRDRYNVDILDIIDEELSYLESGNGKK
jgi:hypothetical protein